jgi:hypothetical protein
MASTKRGDSRKPKKVAKKAKSSKPAKTGKVRKRLEKARPLAAKLSLQEPFAREPEVRERYVITVENIRGDTAIGDLIVTFPRTREVLARKGLRLEAEYAGDIYMTLDVFSAMNGLETANLVQEIVEVAKEPIAPAPQIAPPPLA